MNGSQADKTCMQIQHSGNWSADCLHLHSSQQAVIAVFSPKRYILIQTRHPYTEKSKLIKAWDPKKTRFYIMKMFRDNSLPGMFGE